MFDAVYADPVADGPRAVLADALQERGDPRGEFIALQLAKLQSKPSAAATRRERSLLTKHRRAWLGPLADVVNEPNSTWARGFLDTVVAELSDDTPVDPIWNTVRSLRIVGGYPPKVRVLAAGCFRGLTEFSSIALDDLGTLLSARSKPPIESLSIYGPHARGGAWDPAQLKLVDRLTELPGLRRLSLRVERHPWEASQLDWVWKSPVVSQLSHLELGVNLPFDLAGCLRGLATTQLESFAMSHSYFTFMLTRDRDRAFSCLAVQWHGLTNAAQYLSYVAGPIRALPPDTLTSFRFDHPTARWPARALAVVTNAVARQTRIEPAGRPPKGAARARGRGR